MSVTSNNSVSVLDIPLEPDQFEMFVQIPHLSEGLYAAKDLAKKVKKLVIDSVGFGCVLIGLAADRALVISGEWGGVQVMQKQIYLWLIYIHCVAYLLNLVVSALKDACKNRSY